MLGGGLRVRVLAEAADSEARMCVGSHSEECCWMNFLGQMCSRVFGKASSPGSCSTHARPSSVIFMACSNTPLLRVSGGLCWGLHKQMEGRVVCFFSISSTVLCDLLCFEALRPLLVFFLLPFFSASPKETTCWCVS